jgi:hypothetical protein
LNIVRLIVEFTKARSEEIYREQTETHKSAKAERKERKADEAKRRKEERRKEEAEIEEEVKHLMEVIGGKLDNEVNQKAHEKKPEKEALKDGRRNQGGCHD